MANCANEVVSLANRKVQAYRLCQEYLGGSWKSVSFEKFHIQVLSGGLSNELFICSLPPNYPISKQENRKVLLRIYGRLYSELSHDIHALVSDVVVFALLSERKVGPQLYSIFPEGRLEQLLPGRQLTLSEMKQPKISVKIARKLKKYHDMSLPLCKEPKWMWEFSTKLLEDVDRIVLEDNETSRVVQGICKKYDLHKELGDVRKYIESFPSQVVFCHNDLHEGNILVIQQETDNEGQEQYDYQFIDFEFSAYNYRGYDIATHFCEWMFDYTKKEPPYFAACQSDFPSKDEQLIFIREYLGKTKNCHISIDEEEILEEVKRFGLLTHLCWGIWSLVQATMSTIEFGYLEYAVTRLEFFFEQKKALGLS